MPPPLHAPAPQLQPDPIAALDAAAARLNARAAVANADTARINAEAARDRATVAAVGLPSFEGKTTLNQGAGAIEALILATEALAEAAARIAEVARALEHPPGTPYAGAFLVLAGDEALDFGLVAAVRAEIGAYRSLFDTADPPAESEFREAVAAASLAAPAAAIGALAGLIRTESEVTAVDHAAITHRVLATAVAGQLAGRAILPGAATAALSEDSPLIRELMALAWRRGRIAALAAGAGENPRPDLATTLERFDAFFARVTAADAAGRIPLVEAARLDQLASDKVPLILRVHVEKAGGSLIQLKNLCTFLGADPVRVSGGLVASYAITDAASGYVISADVLNCRTRVGKLREIQGLTSRPAASADAGLGLDGDLRPSYPGLSAGSADRDRAGNAKL